MVRPFPSLPSVGSADEAVEATTTTTTTTKRIVAWPRRASVHLSSSSPPPPHPARRSPRGVAAAPRAPTRPPRPRRVRRPLVVRSSRRVVVYSSIIASVRPVSIAGSDQLRARVPPLVHQAVVRAQEVQGGTHRAAARAVPEVQGTVQRPGRRRQHLPRRPQARSIITQPVPIRSRSRGERRSLRTFAVASLRPGSLAFNPRPRRLSTPRLTPLNSTPTSTLSGGMETPAGPRRSRRRSAGAAGAGDSDDDEAIVLDSPSPSGERGANSDPLLSDVSASALKKKPAAELASRCVDLAKRCPPPPRKVRRGGEERGARARAREGGGGRRGGEGSRARGRGRAQARSISHRSPYDPRSLRTFPPGGVSLRRSRPMNRPCHQITNQSNHFPPRLPPIKRPSETDSSAPRSNSKTSSVRSRTPSTKSERSRRRRRRRRRSSARVSASTSKRARSSRRWRTSGS